MPRRFPGRRGLTTRSGRRIYRSVEWQRGDYQVRLGLYARAEESELTSETVRLRFQPPAPVVALRLGEKAVETTEQKPLERHG